MKKRKIGSPYRIFDHTADVGFDVWGATRRELFSHAATALFAFLTPLDAVEGKADRFLTVDGTDLDDLWINYLRELLYLFNRDRFLVRTADILKIGGRSLYAVFKGETFDPVRHEILTKLKP